jgi:hypothetical protein
MKIGIIGRAGREIHALAVGRPAHRRTRFTVRNG